MKRAAFAVILAAAAHAQPRPEFEVVSIKLGDPTDPASSGRTTPTRLEMRNTTLNNLVRSAYRLNEYQLEGGPKWMDSTKFNVDAKFPAGVPREQTPLMMQSMLADRFKLEFHRVTKSLPEYELVLAKSGPKLTAADPNDPRAGSSSQGPRQIKATAQPISTLARMLESAVGAPVIDRGGLEGKYTFSLAFASLFGTPAEDEKLPTIFTVLQQELGLKLESIRGPVEVMVIDRAEMPSEN